MLLTVAPTIGLYAAAAVAARRGRDVAAGRLALGAALFTGPAIFLTNDVLHVDPDGTYALLLWAGVALAAGIAANIARTGAWRSRPAGLTAISVLWLVLWLVLPAGARASTALQWTWTVVFSGATIHFGAAAVRDASRARDVGQLAVGLVSVVILVIARVVDSRSVMASGVMLFASAILVWWLARLWVRPARAGETG
jgi:hypothetical protein